MTYAVQVALLLVGLLTSYWALRSIQAAKGSGALNSGALLMFALVTLPSFGNAVAIFTGTRHVFAGVRYERTVSISGVGAIAVEVATPTLAIVALTVIMLALRRNPTVNGPLIGVAGLVLALALLHGTSSRLGSIIVYVAVLVAASLVEPGRGPMIGTALGIVAVMAASAIAAVVSPSYALSCGVDCPVWGFEFSGVADNKNSLGLMLAAGIPFAWLGLPVRPRATAVAIMFMILTTASGTAIIAGGASVALLAATRTSPNASTRRLLASWAAGGAALAAVVLPTLPLPSDALTGRFGLWEVAHHLIANRPWIGHGTEAWRNLVDAREIPLAGGYSTHNQILEILFVGGALALAICLCIAGGVIWRSGRAGLLPLIAMPQLLCGITERPWTLGPIDWLAWSLPALLAALPNARKSTRGASRSGVAHRDQRLSPGL